MVTLQLFSAHGADTAAILYRLDSPFSAQFAAKLPARAARNGWGVVDGVDQGGGAGRDEGPLLLVSNSEAPPCLVVVTGPHGPCTIELCGGQALLVPAGTAYRVEAAQLAATGAPRRSAWLTRCAPRDRAAPVDPIFGGLYPLRAARRLGAQLQILYLDESIVVIDKPAGQVVHPHQMEWQLPAAREALAGYLRGKLWTVHRLDRATSGLLLLARSAEVAAELSRQFRERTVHKQYLAVLRGHLAAPCVVETPLRREHNRAVADPASSSFEPLVRGVVDQPVGKYPQGWYTLAKVGIATGRYHQIRRHAASISHPVLGDRQHGDGTQNRFLAAHLGDEALLLRAYVLQFAHPVHGGLLQFRAATPTFWRRALAGLGLHAPDCLHEDTLIAGLPCPTED